MIVRIGYRTKSLPSAMGRKHFQVRYIRLSYRIRGIVARTQTNNAATVTVFITKMHDSIGDDNIEAENRHTVSRLIIKILVYSAIKIRANRPPLNSTLNPETNSDSPSAKSNGVRFVSARLVINHKIPIGMIIIRVHENWYSVITEKSRVFIMTRQQIKISDILTS